MDNKIRNEQNIQPKPLSHEIICIWITFKTKQIEDNYK